MKARICAIFSRGGFGLFFCKEMLGLSAAQIASKFAAQTADGAQGADERAAKNSSPDAYGFTAADEDIFWLDLAASTAWANALLTLPNPAVGCCVISRDGRLLAASAHRAKGGFHAERRALLLARRLHGAAALRGCTVYATLEPCARVGATPACTDIIAECGAARVVYGAHDGTQNGAAKLGSVGICAHFMPHAASAELARAFFAPRWAVFKQALRASGSVRGRISGPVLQRYTHEIRSKITTLATFGATVRADLPTLDARHSLSKRAPDVLIFTRSAGGVGSGGSDGDALADFRALTAAAPLWQVAGRSVRVAEYSAAAIDAAGVCMLEGGPHALALAATDCDWLLLHFDAALSNGPATDYAALSSATTTADNTDSTADIRAIAADPTAHFAHLAPLAGHLVPLALGHTRDGQHYAFYRIHRD